MNIDMLQTGILTAYGNRFLLKGDIILEKNHPAAKNYRNIKFVEKIPKLLQYKRDIISENPNDWFKYLKKKNISRLFLNYHERSEKKVKSTLDSILDKTENSWNIIAQRNGTYDIWNLKRQLENADDMHYYYPIASNIELKEIKYPKLDTTKLYLKEILTDLVNFTKRNELNNWTNVFNHSLDLLVNNNPLDLLSEDFLPKSSYKIEALQILAACDNSWVFGGMGSWNDVVNVDNYDLYLRLTANLYNTLCKAFMYAINSYPE